MTLPKLVIAALIGAASLHLSQSSANEDEQAALCRGDVMRLCMGEIPDRDRIVSCMRAKVGSLSAGCRAVFAGGPQGSGAQRTAKLR